MSEKNENVIEVAPPLRAVLQRVMALEEEGRLMEERLQASLTVALGKLAGEVKIALVGALVEAAGKKMGQAALARDLSTITLQPSPAPPVSPAPATPPVPVDPAKK